MLTPQEVQAARAQYGLDQSSAPKAVLPAAPSTPSTSNVNIPTQGSPTLPAWYTQLRADQAQASKKVDLPPPATQPGFVQSFVQGVTSPFLKAGVTIKQAGQGIFGLAKAGVQNLSGDKAGATQTVNDTAAKVGKTEDLGYFGKVTPGGFDASGKPLSTADSVKDALGTGAEIGSYFVGAGEASALKDAGEVTAKQLIKQGALGGAKVGAVGGFGAGLHSTVGSKDSALGQALTVGRDTLVGAGTGAVIGGVTGGVTAKVKGLPILPERAAKAESDATWKLIKPDLTTAERAQAVTEGRIQTKGALRTVTQVPVGRDLQMVEAAKPYVAKAKNPIEAVANMQKGIAEKATNLRAGLDQTGAIYNKSQIIGQLNKTEPPVMISSDATLKNAYAMVKGKMVSLVGEGGKLGDLLDARKEFDAFVQKQFPNLYNSETLTPMRSAIRDIRGALNDVIESRLPEGKLPDGTSFRQSLKDQSLLYDAIDNTSSKVPKVGTNALEAIMKAHPFATKAIKYGAVGAVGAGLGGVTVNHLLP